MAKNQHTQTQGKKIKRFYQLMTVCYQLGMISENKKVHKLKLEKNVFHKKWSPKLIFKKFRRFLTSKIDFDSTILALFDKPS